jgi:hypothetical protein
MRSWIPGVFPVLSIPFAVSPICGAPDFLTSELTPSLESRSHNSSVGQPSESAGVQSSRISRRGTTPSDQLTAPGTLLHVPKSIRLMVFAPHPDDETLGAGGLIQRV